MSALALILRLALAAVFVVAGIAKLRDREGARVAIVAFGGPEPGSGLLAVLLPVAELVVAFLLLPGVTAAAGAGGALALLVVFSAAIAVSVAHGRAPECHCFGQLHSAPAGWKTLARNAALAAAGVAALAASATGRAPSAVAWIAGLTGTQAVALGVVGTVAVVGTGGALAYVSLLRSYGRALVRLDRAERLLAEHGIVDETEAGTGLAPGTPAPAFAELPDLLAPGLPLLLLFTSAHCGPCKELLPTAAAWQHDHADELTVAFAVAATIDEAAAEAEAHGLAHVLVDDDLALLGAFEATGTPSGVLIAPDGSIASRVAGGADAIEELVARALVPPPREPGLPIGAEAPALELPSLDGETVSLSEFRGRDSLLVFWNPDCGYCRALHEDLLDWERSDDGDGPRLVVISSGDAESTRADGFRSLVLLDDAFAAGDAFEAHGTPIGVRLDADGRVASRLAVGGDAILALARRRSAALPTVG